MTTAADLIAGALRALNRIGVNETPSNEAYAAGLSTLNMMLDTFALKQLFIYVTTQNTKTLTTGTASYTIGSGADIDATRPTRIAGAFIRDDGYDYEIDQISEDEYRRIVSKTTSGRPQKLWYKPSYANGYLYLYPTPDAAYALHIDCITPFTAFSGITSSVSFPPGYVEALKYNLAIRLAPDHGISAPGEVVALAAAAMRNLKDLNMVYGLTPAQLEIPGVALGQYNIFTDEY